MLLLSNRVGLSAPHINSERNITTAILAPSSDGFSNRGTEIQVAANTTGTRPVVTTVPPANAVMLMGTQIPEFGAGDEENAQTWVQRVERAARIHGATDDVILLAASSKLTKAARRWYDVQSGRALESWIGLKEELLKM